MLRIQTGFTLIELMITVAIMSIMLTVGLPSFQSLIASSRVTSTTNAMVSALQLARSEALRQHKSVVVAHKQSGTWQDGWDVFVDLNDDEIPQENEQILASTIFDSVKATVTIKSSYSDFVIYDATGRVSSSSSGTIGGNFTFCSSGTYRKVTIAGTGRIRIEIPSSC